MAVLSQNPSQCDPAAFFMDVWKVNIQEVARFVDSFTKSAEFNSDNMKNMLRGKLLKSEEKIFAK